MIKFILTLCLLIISPSIGYSQIVLDSLEEAEKLSLSVNKPILLILGADYCEYCKNLKDNIIYLPIDNYIICYIDITKTSNDDFKNLKSIPESRIIMNQKIISKNIGYNKTKYSLWLKKYHDL